MTKVLVIGASGYIGNAVAKAFSREGHETYGLVRSPAQALSLSQDEIIPVVGKVEDHDSWSSTAASVNVIVDASMDYTNPKVHTERLFEGIRNIAKAKKGGKLTFIYSSGWWTYKENGTPTFTENDESKTFSMAAWRRSYEDEVINSTDFVGIVLRPANVYGRSGSLFGAFFGPSPIVYGDDLTTWSVVHVDDLAQAYVLAAQKSVIAGGQIFNLANKTTENVLAIAKASTRASGLQAKVEIKTPDPSNFLQVGCSASGNAWSEKAEELLGWRQKHSGVVDGIDRYYFTWKSYQK